MMIAYDPNFPSVLYVAGPPNGLLEKKERITFQKKRKENL